MNFVKCLRKGQRKNGFTLIELLVVIAIIALLAAILFPVFARARENARRANCQSNMKQITLGIMQYTQDYDERYPPYGGSNLTASGGPNCHYYDISGNGSGVYVDNSWATDELPYVKSSQVFVCPSDAITATRTLPAGQLQCSYAYNDDGVPPNDMSGPSGMSLSRAVAPSVLIMWFEEIWPSFDTIACQNGDGRFLSNVVAMSRHLDGTNFSFADGHVKWYKPSPDPLGGSTQKGISFDPTYTGP